jgi:hypothetical protein
MKFDRREFIGIGAAGALGTLGLLRPGWLRGAASQPAPPSLKMRFKGLCLFQGQTSAMIVHMIDNMTLKLPEHLMDMRVPGDAIDPDRTKAKPDGIETPGNILRWRLNRRKISGPSPQKTSDLVLVETVPADPVKPSPDTEDGWKSLHWLPDLRSICGATKILEPAAATITLNHGELRSMKADGSGPDVVWKFIASDDTEIPGLRRRLTNRILYSCPSAAPLTLMVDSDPIVFKAGADVIIDVTNLPACPPPPNRPLNMEHFMTFYGLVDATRKPKPVVHEHTIPRGGSVEPDYCPPGRI